MPITAAVNEVLEGRLAPPRAVELLLARDPRPDPALLQRLLARVEELGYDRWALRITQHP